MKLSWRVEIKRPGMISKVFGSLKAVSMLSINQQQSVRLCFRMTTMVISNGVILWTDVAPAPLRLFSNVMTLHWHN